jgi:hypothetical protein
MPLLEIPMRPLLYSCLTLCLLIAGCSDDDDIVVPFGVTEPIPQTTISGDPALSSLGNAFGTLEFTLNVEEQPEFLQQDFDELESVAVTGVRLLILDDTEAGQVDPLEDGEPDNWNFLQSIYLYAGAGGQEALVAFLEPGQVPQDQQQIFLRTTGENIVPIVEEPGGFTLRLAVDGNVPPDNVFFVGEVTYTVRVRVFD